MSKNLKGLDLYDRVCTECSRSTTGAYSTSFSLSIRALSADIRDDIHAIYGLVRFADEIVDSFDGHDQARLLERFKRETFQALEDGVSTNPIIHAFQRTYRRFELEAEHLDLFFRSMEWDLCRTKYNRADFDAYITGSAEVVGLMCLKVFVRGDGREFDRLKPAAMRLGAAFQKVNFLRDLREDYLDLGRLYFPNIEISQFDDSSKRHLENEIEADLKAAYEGIVQLPRDARFGVELAYAYYSRLLRRIRNLNSRTILNARIRVPDFQKGLLLASTYTKHHLGLY